MGTEECINGLKRLLKDSEDKKMDSFTAKQKIKQAFDFADPLLLKIQDPEVWNSMNFTINLSREYIDKYEHRNFDLAYFCNSILLSWYHYTTRIEQDRAEKERRKTLTELKKQGKI